MGFEPTTPTLARLCSTTELRPQSIPKINFSKYELSCVREHIGLF